MKRSLTALFLCFMLCLTAAGCGRRLPQPTGAAGEETVSSAESEGAAHAESEGATHAESETAAPAETEGSTAESGEGESTHAEGLTVLTLNAVGDCTLGNDVDQPQDRCFNAMYRQVGNDLDYFLGGVRQIFAADDLTIANLECTLTDRGAEAQKVWSFRGEPAYAKILSRSSVEAATFANNHNRDYGDVSYTDTISHLTAEGVAVAVEDRTVLLEVKGIKVGLFAVQSAFLAGEGTANREYYDTGALKTRTDSCISALKAQGAQLIIAAYHWGIEGADSVTAQQKELGHYAVDRGADLVLGTHPHCLQPVECYQGRYIVYSLANFCYGGHTNPGDKDTFIWQQQFCFADGVLTDCRAARLIPCSLSGASDRNDYRPVTVSGNAAQNIISRINRMNGSAGFSLRIGGDGTVNP